MRQCPVRPVALRGPTSASGPWLRSTLLVLAVGASAPVAALGLGEITVRSRLHERLDARIALQDVSVASAGSVSVDLGSASALGDAGIEHRAILRRLRFSVERGGDGGYAVHVTSTEPVTEPFLRFPLRVSTGDIQVTRDYTVLLDPPPVVAGDRTSTTADSGGGKDDGAAAGAGAEPADPPAFAPGIYGPVVSGESVWDIAESLRPTGVSIYQMIIALARANPGAFYDGDIGRLKTDVRLQVPPPDTAAAIAHNRAVAEYGRQVDTGPEDTPPERPGVPEPAADRPAPDAGPDADPDDSPALSPVADGQAADMAPVADGQTADMAPVASEPPVLTDTVPSGDVRFDGIEARMKELTGAVADLEQRLAQPRDRVEAALSRQSRQLGRLEEAVAGLRLDVADMRAERPAAGTDRRGLSRLTGALLVAAAALMGALLGFVGGRRSQATTPPARAAKAAEARHGAATPPSREPAATESDAARARVAEGSAADAPKHADKAAPPAAAAALSGQVSRDVNADPDEDFDIGPDANADDHLFWADLYIAEGLPRGAIRILREGVGIHGDSPALRFRLLEAFYQDGARDEFLREFEGYRDLEPSEEQWERSLAMGATLAPDDARFAGATAAPAYTTGAAVEEPLEHDLSPEEGPVLVLDDEVAPDESPGEAGPTGDTEEPLAPEGGVIEFDPAGLADLDDATPIHGGPPESPDTRHEDLPPSLDPPDLDAPTDASESAEVILLESGPDQWTGSDSDDALEFALEELPEPVASAGDPGRAGARTADGDRSEDSESNRDDPAD